MEDVDTVSEVDEDQVEDQIAINATTESPPSSPVPQPSYERKRSSFMTHFSVPKPNIPPPPPPVDLSALAAQFSITRDPSTGAPSDIFASKEAIIRFEARVKTMPLGILKPAVLELDLKALVMRISRPPKQTTTGVSLDCIVSTKMIPQSTVEITFATGGDLDGHGHLLGGSMHTKRYYFQDAQVASSFTSHLDVMRESGSKLLKIFESIDKRGTGNITSSILKRAMKENGMAPNNLADAAREAEDMIMLADSDINSGIDFTEFFRLFMFTPCLTVHQALTEWRNKLALVQTKRSSAAAAEAPEHGGGKGTKFDGSWVMGGEIVMNVVENVRYSFGNKARDNLDGSSHHWVGTLAVTNYRLVLQSHLTGQKSVGGRHEISPYFDRMDIPVNTIHSIVKLDSSCVLLTCKDLRPVLCSFEPNDIWVTTLVTAIQTLAFPGARGPRETFAFSFALDYKEDSKLKGKTLVNGWDLYSPTKEFERIGVLNSPHARFYRIWSDNYTLSETYPRQFCVPSDMSESDIMKAAKFRSKCRMPAVSWRCKRNGAVLVRSAQPMVGLKSNRNAADEKLLNLYRVRGDIHNPIEMEYPSTLYILDARKIIAATGNQVQGKGTEIIGNYAHAELAYCNIENIHTMRDSINNIGAASINPDGGKAKDGFNEHLNDSLWLRHVQLVLKAAVLGAERIELNGSSVLVHCSDGWDRTSQMSSTTMLMLDPYYRTITGFAILIEKEWLEFGHKFKDRHGQASDKHPNERSPVFVQWLDVIHQIMLQYPSAFEFNERLLVFIADMVHSCLFGTFLGNNAKEREITLGVKENTVSIWTYVLAKKDQFLNHRWEGEEKGDGKILWPSTSIKKMKLWERYFCRFDYEAHPRAIEDAERWVDDWGERL